MEKLDMETDMVVRKIILLLALTGMITTMNGCLWVAAGAGAGAGYVAYRNGQLVTPADVSVERAADATAAALRELNLPEVSRNVSMEGITFVSRDPDDKKITIFCEKRTDASCNILIRVGNFGDQDTSRLIQNTIDDHL